MFSVGAFILDLAAADRGDDFDSIASGDHGFRVPAARDDLAILLDRDALALESQLADEIGHPGRGRPADIRCAIKGNRDHQRLDVVTEVEIITPGAEFKPAARCASRGRTWAPRRLAAIAQHRFSEDRELALEMPAGVAKQEVQAHQPPLSRREALVLHLRDQPARVLASDKQAH
jgi:hypothetical protein